MAHNTNGIAKLFKKTKSKFNNNNKLVNNLIKYLLDQVFENHLW